MYFVFFILPPLFASLNNTVNNFISKDTTFSLRIERSCPFLLFQRMLTIYIFMNHIFHQTESYSVLGKKQFTLYSSPCFRLFHTRKCTIIEGKNVLDPRVFSWYITIRVATLVNYRGISVQRPSSKNSVKEPTINWQNVWVIVPSMQIFQTEFHHYELPF